MFHFLFHFLLQIILPTIYLDGIAACFFGDWGCLGLTAETKELLQQQTAGAAWYKDDTGTSAQVKRECDACKKKVKTWHGSVKKGFPVDGGVLEVGVRQEFAHNKDQPWTCRFTSSWDGKISKWT